MIVLSALMCLLSFVFVCVPAFCLFSFVVVIVLVGVPALVIFASALFVL